MKEEWKNFKVADLGLIITGKTPKTSIKENYGGKMFFLTPSDDMSLKFIKNTIRTLSKLGVQTVKNFILPKSSICVSCIGSDLGKVVITTKETVTNQQINSIIVDIAKFDVNFCYYSMLLLGKILKIHSKTSTAVPIINKSTFSNYEIQAPPLKTQQQVAQVLSSLDDKIELNNAINKNLEEQAQAIFKSWFVDFEPFGGTMPDDWEISSLFENSYCNFIKPSISSFSGEKTYIATADVNLNKIISKVTKITYKKRPSRANMEPCLNSIWFAKMKNSRKNILINNAWEQNYNKLILSTGFYGIKILSNALHYFWCIISSEQFDMIKNGFCNGTTMQAINNDGVSKINIVIPSEKIIYQFNEKISPLFELIEKNNIENERLSSLRDTLLPKLMSGEIDVSNVKVTAEVMRV